MLNALYPEHFTPLLALHFCFPSAIWREHCLQILALHFLHVVVVELLQPLDHLHRVTVQGMCLHGMAVVLVACARELANVEVGADLKQFLFLFS